MFTLHGVDEEYHALQWLSDEELVGARRHAIRAVNLLDPNQADFPVVEARWQRTLSLVRQVQDERRRHDR